MNKEQIVDKYMKEVMPMTTKFDYGIIKQQLFNLLEYAENEQLILCGVVKSLKNKYNEGFWVWIESFQAEDDSYRLFWFTNTEILSTEEMWQKYNEQLKTF